MNNWESLFHESGGNGSRTRRCFKLIRRGGVPLLYLPAARHAAVATLSLYPAQTPVARLAKRLLTLGLWLPIPLAGQCIELHAGAPFLQFLAAAAESAPGAAPLFGLLAGNPNAPGRRYIFLLFNAAGQPHAIVKAGINPEAERLIAIESAAIEALPAGLAGATTQLGIWHGSGAKALALPFVAGEPPSPGESAALENLLLDWLDHGSPAPLSSLPGWQSLEAAGVQPGRLLPAGAETREVLSPVAHGDLAPWNIKEHEGRWTVLDWERGTLRGVPAWDWFHYILQPAVLVEKCGAEALVERALALLAGDAFRRYAQAARIEGLERALLAAYLAHCTEVIRQTEGAAALAGARERLLAGWDR